MAFSNNLQHVLYDLIINLGHSSLRLDLQEYIILECQIVINDFYGTVSFLTMTVVSVTTIKFFYQAIPPACRFYWKDSITGFISKA